MLYQSVCLCDCESVSWSVKKKTNEFVSFKQIQTFTCSTQKPMENNQANTVDPVSTLIFLEERRSSLFYCRAV